jgi:hypothetical protein
MKTSNETMITILQTIEIELMALERPTSPFRSPVNAGAAEAIGLNTKITNV